MSLVLYLLGTTFNATVIYSVALSHSSLLFWFYTDQRHMAMQSDSLTQLLHTSPSSCTYQKDLLVSQVLSLHFFYKLLGSCVQQYHMPMSRFYLYSSFHTSIVPYTDQERNSKTIDPLEELHFKHFLSLTDQEQI